MRLFNKNIMSSYKVWTSLETSWEVWIGGSKNATLPLIGSSLLFETAEIKNVPDISDVHLMIELIESLGSKVTFSDNVFRVDNSHIQLQNLKIDLFKKARATYYLIPALLHRFGEIKMTYPGGCSIGKRKIDGIYTGLLEMWYTPNDEEEFVTFKGNGNTLPIVVNAYFSVGTTVILLMAALGRKNSTTIHLAAFEPHIMNLIDSLRSAGAHISIRYDHSIIITPSKLDSHLTWTVISDYIVSGTFVVIGALTSRDFIDIHNARIEDLTAFLYCTRKMGIKIEELDHDTLRVHRSHALSATNIQTNIYPWLPTDLQSPIAILMTQATGVSKIHEVMFEGRLNWLTELEKMKGHIAITNPHEALIFWKTDLRGANVSSWDLRSGASMIIAGMIASWVTELDDVKHVERGYEKFVEKLQSIWVNIEKN